MIRFACPGCSATFTVDDSKGGKAGKCPKCNAQFLIPEADPPAALPPPPPRSAPPPPPPPMPADGPVEIKPCPKCQTALTVEAGDLGLDVECPTCQTVFKAERPGVSKQSKAPPPAPPPAPPKRSAMESTDETGRPKSSRRRDDEEDDDRPRSRRRRDDDEDEDDRPRRRSQRDEDEDDDDRPRRRSRRDDDDEEDDRPRRRRRRMRESPANSTAMTLGILSLFLWCCPIIGLIVGIIAITKANEALSDTDGEQGRAPQIMGIVGVVLSILNGIAGVILRLNGIT